MTKENLQKGNELNVLIEEQKKIKRYDMEYHYNRYCQEDQIKPVESENGRWVEYDDISFTADQRANVIRLCEKVIKQYEECHANNTSKGICSGCGYLLSKQLLEEFKE